MSAKPTRPVAKRAFAQGLLTKTTSTQQDLQTIRDLSSYADTTYPNTPVLFPPFLVGYDTAANRQSWEATYEGSVGELWAPATPPNLCTYSEWHIRAFGTTSGGIARTHRLGLFVTETEGWVGQPPGLWARQTWHAWGACLYPNPTGGKILVIFDSNVEGMMSGAMWSKAQPDSEADLEPKQISLLRVLRTERHVNITQVWLGGSGNTAQGLCLPLTYDWCKRVVDRQGLPSSPEELRDLGYYQLIRKTGARGQPLPERQPYIKKGEGGDGRGKLAEGSGAGGGMGRRELRSRG
jgi:hypothetical protein